MGKTEMLVRGLTISGNQKIVTKTHVSWSSDPYQISCTLLWEEWLALEDVAGMGHPFEHCESHVGAHSGATCADNPLFPRCVAS
jgi:hypothetical protein